MSYMGPQSSKQPGIDPAVKRPPVRYFGGKFLLAPKIVKHFPPHRRYVEVFGGGGSILLRKERSHSDVYNDLDARMVNLFRVLRDPDQAADLGRRLYLTPFARDSFEQTQSAPWPEDPVENAAYTVIRSQMGFGANALHSKNRTGFRANAIRNNTSPPTDWMRLPEHIPSIVERMRGVVIESRDFRELIPSLDCPNSLFYLDPPYPVSTRGVSGNRAYCHDMTDEDHEDLADLLKRVKGMVVVSGYACPLYDRLFGEWRQHAIKAHADGGGARTEVLWFSPNTPPIEPQLFQ